MLLVDVQDTQNLGAIIRSTYAFGFDALVISDKKSAPLNQQAIAASAGAALKLPIVRIGNISQCVEKLKKQGFWLYGTDVSEEAQDYNQVKFDQKTVLVMGSEGKGLRDNIKKKCDFLIHIPIKFNSLNVSVATGVIASKIYSDSANGI